MYDRCTYIIHTWPCEFGFVHSTEFGFLDRGTWIQWYALGSVMLHNKLHMALHAHYAYMIHTHEICIIYGSELLATNLLDAWAGGQCPKVIPSQITKEVFAKDMIANRLIIHPRGIGP